MCIRDRNVSGPFLLVLSDAYSPLWKIRLRNTDAKNVKMTHMKANWYANSWLIESDLPTLELTVLYEGENYLELSLVLFFSYVVVSIVAMARACVRLPKKLQAKCLAS